MSGKNSNLEAQTSSQMALSSERLKTYTHWPFKKNCHCTPKKMAEAGFYLCSPKKEPDLARCYFCHKELDGWEPSDDPWEEHRNHAPQCRFAQLGKKESEIAVHELMEVMFERGLILFEQQRETYRKKLVQDFEDHIEELKKRRK